MNLRTLVVKRTTFRPALGVASRLKLWVTCSAGGTAFMAIQSDP